MHIAAALERHLSRRDRPSADGAGVGQGLGGPGPGRPRRCPWCAADLSGHKLPAAWCCLGFLVVGSGLCIGLFEATRLTTHVLRSPCTVLGSEVLDVGSCTLCDDTVPATCEVHPIATARLAVTFKPLHADENVTGWVWYCKGQASVDPCQRQSRFLDQLALDIRSFGDQGAQGGPFPCTVGEVFAYMQLHAMEGEARQCYYSSRDMKAEDVWLSMPSPGLVDHAWFEKHLEYPVLLALGGLVLLGVLLGCLSLEGAELWASGLI